MGGRILKKRVIPNQRARWCGNLHRHRDCITSKDGDCHTSDVGHWFAMTGKSGVGISIVQQAAFSKNVSFRTSSQTGVGISLVIVTASF